MLVTEDDMKHELGEWLVTSLNKDKIITGLVGQAKALKELVVQQREIVATAEASVKSNAQFKTKNEALANALTDERSKARIALGASQDELALRDAELLEANKKANDAIETTTSATHDLMTANGKIAELLQTVSEVNDKLARSKAQVKTLKTAAKKSKE